MNANQPFGSLSPEKIQLFVAGLSGLSKDEVRKAKSLYIRNAISELRAFDGTANAMGCMFALFFLIPIFWPFLYFQRQALKTQRQLAVEKIENAISVWRDDLEGEHFEIPR